MDYICYFIFVNECPLLKFPGGLQALHSANKDSITWLCKLSIC